MLQTLLIQGVEIESIESSPIEQTQPKLLETPASEVLSAEVLPETDPQLAPELAPEAELEGWSDLLSPSPDLVIDDNWLDANFEAEFSGGFEPVISAETAASSEFDLSSIDFALSDPGDLTLADFTADLFEPVSPPVRPTVYSANNLADNLTESPIDRPEINSGEQAIEAPADVLIAASAAPAVEPTEIEPTKIEPTEIEPTEIEPTEIEPAKPVDTQLDSPSLSGAAESLTASQSVQDLAEEFSLPLPESSLELALDPPSDLPALAPALPPALPPAALSESFSDQTESTALAIDPAIGPADSQIGLVHPIHPPAPLVEQLAPSPAADFSSELDAETVAQLDQLLAEPSTEPSVELAAPRLQSPDQTQPHQSSGQWSLGIDLGTTGISAVLLDQTTHQLYPLYWQEQEPEPKQSATKKLFRLSTTATVHSTTSPTASPLSTLRRTEHSSDSTLHLSDWKPYLNIAIPHHSPQTSQWEPVLQWSDSQTLAIRTIQEVLQQFLLSLAQPDQSPDLSCGALGLEISAFQAIVQNLSSIVVGYASQASDTYSFNLREAVLQAGLVSQPDQILFMEEAVAGLLSALPATSGQHLMLSSQIANQAQASQGHLHNASWQGCTLVLTAGASSTELLLVQLPTQLQTLNPTDFYLRSLPYAGEGLDQDIICQLLYPKLASESEQEQQGLQPAMPEADFWIEQPLPVTLLDGLELPAAADPDPRSRRQLQQRLADSIAGQQLLQAARWLKITLQYQSHCRLRFGDRLLNFERQDLTSRVLLPYIQQLNRDLNALLAQTSNHAAAVNQVICTGGTASLNAITRWLRQKLPNATIIQDTYARPSGLSSPSFEHSISSCSRIAYGLAALPLHPQLIDQSRHRYSDCFLLRALLQTLPPQPLPLEEILARLEQRGIETQLCRLRILALLEGQLPPGLVPSPVDISWLAAASAANPDYQAIRLAPLFEKFEKSARCYAPNRPQWHYLQRYLETLLADTEQRLNQPLVMPEMAVPEMLLD